MSDFSKRFVVFGLDAQGLPVGSGMSTLSASLTSSTIELKQQYGFSVHCTLSSSFANGAATGSLKLQAGNISGSWVDVPDSSVSGLKHGDSYFVSLPYFFVDSVRVVYTPSTQFTGSISGWAAARG